MRSVGIHYKRWGYLPYDAADFIARARELGYDQIELDAQRLAANTVLSRTRIGFEARTHRMDLSYTWSPNQEGDLASLDEERRRSAVQEATRLIKVIGQMGGGSINGAFYAIFPPHWELAGQREHFLEQAVKSVRSLAWAAENEDVLLNIKPINRSEHFLLPDAESALSFVQAVNHSSVGIDLDTYHMALEEESIEEAITRTAVYLKTIHVRESDQGRVGEGTIDWAAVRAGLDAIHYDGPLIHNPTILTPIVDRPHESNVIRGLLIDENPGS
ncbi:MAG: sugar phosphate isomerase/epimerase [Sphaerochaeta sp.]|nr:sugar phosphate isomerase/epimerase [Sphaerochaeta sp.]